jgi:hypothetical protein
MAFYKLFYTPAKLAVSATQIKWLRLKGLFCALSGWKKLPISAVMRKLFCLAGKNNYRSLKVNCPNLSS